MKGLSLLFSFQYLISGTPHNVFPALCITFEQAVRVLTPSNGEQLPTVLSQRFTSETGYRVEFTLEAPTRIADEVKFQFQTNGKGPRRRLGALCHN